MLLYVFSSSCLFIQAACGEIPVLHITLRGIFSPVVLVPFVLYPPACCLPHEGRKTVVHSVSGFSADDHHQLGPVKVDGVSSGPRLLLKLHSDPAWMGLESSSEGSL